MGLIDDVDDGSIFVDPDLMPGTRSATYHPVGASDVPINVQCWYEPVADLSGMPMQMFKVFVARDATLGVTSVNASADCITIAYRTGETARRRRVASIAEEDAGGFVLVLE